MNEVPHDPGNAAPELECTAADARLLFETKAGPIGNGYHVTEMKYADVTSVDCGARLASWAEASLQLLDGNHGDLMTVGKFATILARSIGKIDKRGGSPLHVEFRHGITRLQIYHPQAPQPKGSTVSVRLSDGAANASLR